MTSAKRHIRGFTLIEMMITAAAIAILTAIAYPGYTRMMIKVRRSDAHESLMKAVAMQEQFYIDNKRYATRMSELGYVDTDGAGPATADAPFSREGYYVTTVNASTTHTFTLQAAPVSGKPQSRDTYCGTLSITDKGVKGKTGSAGLSDCW